MFIGWIRHTSIDADLEHLAKEVLLDINLIKNTLHTDPSLCFGIYDKNQLHAIVSGFEFQNHIIINNFSYTQKVIDSDKIKLLQLLIQNINSDKPVTILVSKNEKKLFLKLDFTPIQSFKKAKYLGGAVFNFSSTQAKSISNENYSKTIQLLDKKVFKDNRYEYINRVMMKQSSLVQSTSFGYLHSYALNKSIVKLSPFIVLEDAYSDAEKLLRGVIYHRGLKTLISFIPADQKEIIQLYENYKFEVKEDYELLCLGSKPTWNWESVYGW